MGAVVPEPDGSSLPGPATIVLRDRQLRPGTDTASLSRFADDRWNLTPALFAAHSSALHLNFRSTPPAFRTALKHFCWAILNIDGERAAVSNHQSGVLAIRTVDANMRFGRVFAEWLHVRGLTRFADVTADDLDDYLVHIKKAEITHSTREDLLAVVIKMWAFRTHLPAPDRLPEAPPWNGDRPQHLLERARHQEIATPRVHPETMKSLLAWSLRLVEDFATDITASFREHDRLRRRSAAARQKAPVITTAERDKLRRDLVSLLREYRRRDLPLPGLASRDGEIALHRGHLARLLGTQSQTLAGRELAAVLALSRLPIEEGAYLHIDVTGTLDGQLWRARPVTEAEAVPLARVLIGACFVVIAYLSGMRPGEVLTLERGCLHRDERSGLLLLTGREWKNVRDEHGSADPRGRVRPDPWVVAEPVATAIEVLQRLHDGKLLFPNRIGELTLRTVTSSRQNRLGQARTTNMINHDIVELIRWVDEYCTSHGRHDAIPPDPVHPTITGRRLRRTLAWFIARKPRGLVAAAIQYGHLEVQMTLGYAGTYASGFQDDLAFEVWLERLDNLVDAHDRLTDGEHVSGPAADAYRQRVIAAQRFAGRTIRTNKEARNLLGNGDLQIYTGSGITCVFDPRRAACQSPTDNSTHRTPDTTDCRPHCVNIAHTDRDMVTIEADAGRLRQVVDDPFAPPIRTDRERHELARLKSILTQHDEGRAR